MKKIGCVLVVFWLALSASARLPALIPAPQKIAWTGGELDCSRYQVTAPAEAGFAVAELEKALADGRKDSQGAKITLRFGAVNAPGNEAYTLDATSNRLVITAPASAGLLYGVETLRQLLAGTTTLPCCEITDWPAFPWRGFMHDVGRNFQDLALLERFVDVMAQYKLNIFHFHLTDNPGWRIECRVHPELNDPKNYSPTRSPGKFYTYAELKDFIAYCAQRGITVVPEIDMPGHSDYFQRAFGVTMQSPTGAKILADCVNEFLDQVHPQYFHMGSDEVNVQNPAFMDQMAGLIRQHGCQLLVWRPGHLPGGKVITQLWSAGRAPNSPLPGLPAVDSRNDYGNALDPFEAPLRLLNLATDGTSSGGALALGGTLCLWPDVNIGADQMNIYRQNPVFPALLAAAENYWHGGMVNRPEDWTRLPADTNDPAFAQFADFESRLMAHRDLYFRDWPFPYVKQTDILWQVIGPFPLKNNPPVERDLRDSYTVDGKTYRWVTARGATLFINHFWYGASVLPAAKEGVAYALTYVWSPQAQTVGFWIGFNDPIRSGRRGVPNPAQGEWSNVGSRIWINDREMPPPHWRQPGILDPENEIPFVDESYYFRSPTPVALQAGWNKILVKAPKTNQAFKWSVTCVPVQVDGDHCHEVEGLRFAIAPDKN
jgi:hexosaminidase